MTFTEDVLRLKDAEIEALKLENVRLLLELEKLKSTKNKTYARNSKIHKP